MPDILDVVVAGAGPTGLLLANVLGAEGVSVLVVERNPSTVREPRAVSIDDESLRALQGAGLLDVAMRDIVPGYGSTYLTSGGKPFLRVAPTGRPFGHPRRNAFRQPVLERQLREGLARFPSVELRFDTAVESFAQSPEAVTVDVSGPAGRGSVRSRYLVGCDGGRSLVRGLLGSRLQGTTPPERWLIVDLEDSPSDRDTVVFCDPARPCIALPGPDLTRRFEFKLSDGEDEARMTSDDMVRDLIGRHGADPRSRIVRRTVYAFHARIADRWSDRRVFLAGDAAHLTPPFAGQGMNSGVRDAQNLGWKLAMVLDGRAAPGLLATYEVERRDHVASMIELALRMGRVMGPASRWRAILVQSAFRAMGLWPPLRAYFGEMRYKPRPRFERGLLMGPAHPLLGQLLPQPTVSAPGGATGLLDDFLPRGMVLLGVDTEAADVERVREGLALRGVEAAVAELTVRGPRISRRLGLVGDAPPQLDDKLPHIFLLRPDRYVAAAFRPEHADRVLASPLLHLISKETR